MEMDSSFSDVNAQKNEKVIPADQLFPACDFNQAQGARLSGVAIRTHMQLKPHLRNKYFRDLGPWSLVLSSNSPYSSVLLSLVLSLIRNISSFSYFAATEHCAYSSDHPFLFLLKSAPG